MLLDIKLIYIHFFSTKSLKCTRNAFTEMLISQNEIPNEISKEIMLKPNKYKEIVWYSKNNNIIENTDKNKHKTPNNCM